MYIEIETERLVLRPLNPADGDFIIQLLNSEGWLNFIGDRNVKNSDNAKQYIEKILGNSKYFYSVFELKNTGQPIGIVTFLERDNQIYPDIGFALLPAFEKRGYTYEACKSYLDAILKTNKFENIIAITFSNNTKSISLLTKLGLTYELDYEENGKTVSRYSL